MIGGVNLSKIKDLVEQSSGVDVGDGSVSDEGLKNRVTEVESRLTGLTYADGLTTLSNDMKITGSLTVGGTFNGVSLAMDGGSVMVGGIDLSQIQQDVSDLKSGSGSGGSDTPGGSGGIGGSAESTDSDGNTTKTTVETKADGLYVTTETTDKEGNVTSSSEHNVGESLDRLQESMQEANRNMASLERKVGELDSRISDVGAMSAAMSSLKPLGYDPDAPTEISAGVGQYHGSTAYALGIFHYPNRDLMLNLQYASSGSSETMVSGGVTVRLGRGKAKAKAAQQAAESVTVIAEAEKPAMEARYSGKTNEFLASIAEGNYAKAETLIAPVMKQKLTQDVFDKLRTVMAEEFGTLNGLTLEQAQETGQGIEVEYWADFEKQDAQLIVGYERKAGDPKIISFVVEPVQKAEAAVPEVQETAPAAAETTVVEPPAVQETVPAVTETSAVQTDDDGWANRKHILKLRKYEEAEAAADTAAAQEAPAVTAADYRKGAEQFLDGLRTGNYRKAEAVLAPELKEKLNADLFGKVSDAMRSSFGKEEARNLTMEQMGETGAELVYEGQYEKQDAVLTLYFTPQGQVYNFVMEPVQKAEVPEAQETAPAAAETTVVEPPAVQETVPAVTETSAVQNTVMETEAAEAPAATEAAPTTAVQADNDGWANRKHILKLRKYEEAEAAADAEAVLPKADAAETAKPEAQVFSADAKTVKQWNRISETFVDSLVGGQYRKAKLLMSKELNDRLDEDLFGRVHTQLIEVFGKKKQLELKDVRSDGQVSELVYVSVFEKQNAALAVQLVQEGGKELVNSFVIDPVQ